MSRTAFNYGRSYNFPVLIKRPLDWYIKVAVSIYLVLLPQVFVLLLYLVIKIYNLPSFPFRYLIYMIKNFFRPQADVSQWLSDIGRYYMLFEIGIASLVFSFICCLIWLLLVLKAKETTVIHRGTKVDTAEMQKAVREFK